MAEMRERLDAPVLVGVGAAFDFHAGPRAPGAGLDAVVGLEWAFRLAQEPRRLWRRYLRYNPRFVAGFVSQYARAAVVPAPTTASLPDVSIDVSVIGIGRVGLPLALSFADRGLSVLGVDADPERLAAVARGPHALRRARRAGGAGPRARLRPPRAVRLASPTPPRAENIVITLGTPSFSHIEIDMRDIRSALDDLLRAPAPGPDDRAALDRRAGHDRLRRRLPRQAPRLAGRRGRVRRPRAGAHRRRALLRGDRHAAVHRRRRRRARRASAPRSCSRRSPRRSRRRRPSRPSWRRSGPTSCATRRSRCPTS